MFIKCSVTFNVTKRDYLLTINFPAFLTRFCIINPVILPVEHHTLSSVLPLRLNLFINQFDLRGRRVH